MGPAPQLADRDTLRGRCRSPTDAHQIKELALITAGEQAQDHPAGTIWLLGHERPVPCLDLPDRMGSVVLDHKGAVPGAPTITTPQRLISIGADKSPPAEINPT
jgi:hypothetical protein